MPAVKTICTADQPKPGQSIHVHSLPDAQETVRLASVGFFVFVFNFNPLATSWQIDRAEPSFCSHFQTRRPHTLSAGEFSILMTWHTLYPHQMEAANAT